MVLHALILTYCNTYIKNKTVNVKSQRHFICNLILLNTNDIFTAKKI